ncbi:Lrp/AsnC family transcriptional regulator [Eilatimonas milleporae]|uniref:AsnC family transcriptional regulator n=1 Tax=Eilatimonas milleporae TaxID=911205 RepID=A0A3M0CDB6_9PROT|nr:Lrp/AsnC family transcriptional regulator [Eilatimonas milleporae]RMB07814.1 AsnC family transcriptional regulator [Eilatimonas milleporae]
MLDETDRRLLDLLRENARLGISDLARRTGLARSTVQTRLDRLERGGAIQGYTVRLGQAATGALVRAQVMMKVAPKAQDAVVARCRGLSAVTVLHTISGGYDLVAEVAAPDTEALDAALDSIGRMEGVERTQSSVLLSTKINRG